MAKPIALASISATLSKISQGGQGVVYRAPSVRTAFAKSMVYKEYKQSALTSLDVSALQAMPEFLEKLRYSEGAQLISIAAWPCRVVEENGNPTGFVMPTISDEFFTDFWTVKGPSKVAAEFQHLLNEPQVLARSFGGRIITDRERYSLLRKLSSALTFLHGHGVCVGDLSPKNLLFSLSGTPEIFFIDCDAMRVNGVSLTAQLETPGWEVPKGEEKATPNSDRYKLGLLALRLIVGSQDAKDPARLPASVPANLRKVISDTLSQSAGNRPTLSAWDSALEQAWNAAPLHSPPPPPARKSPPAQQPPYSPPTQTVPIVHPRPAASPSPPPPTQMQSAPNPGAGPSSRTLGWLLMAALLAILIVAVKVASMGTSSDGRGQHVPTTATTTPHYWGPASTTPTVPPRTATTPLVPTATSSTPTSVVPPPGTPGLDPKGADCAGGYYLKERSGWATHAMRGSARTSCVFTDSVLATYWNTYPQPSGEQRLIYVSGAVWCNTVSGAVCAPDGQHFKVICEARDNPDWIICEGGVDARVYLY